MAKRPSRGGCETKSALIVGGTGGTGVLLVHALRERGYEVTIYHRGTHEAAGLEDIEHIHGDPHFEETIERDLRGRRWDLAIATYGRIRLLAAALAGRTDRLITISGSPAARRLPMLPTYESDGYPDPGHRLVDRIVETERAVLDGHARGHYSGTIIRYPYVYGPGSLFPDEWHVIKRVQDGRRRWILPGGGAVLQTRAATRNAVHLIGLAIDKPDASAGQIYQASDDRQYPFREWIRMTAGIMGYEFEFVDVPWSILVGKAPGPIDPMAGDHLRGAPRGGGFRTHHVLSHAKAKVELGYEDAVAPEHWLAGTVTHWLAHPPPVDGIGNHLHPDQFDYELEDRILSWWDGVAATAPGDAGLAMKRGHPYDHPKQPGAASPR